MTSNVAVSYVEQLRAGDLYQLTETGSDDADEKGKKEKDSFSISYHSVIKLGAFYLDKFRKSSFSKYEFPISELYASLPELPPKA